MNKIILFLIAIGFTALSCNAQSTVNLTIKGNVKNAEGEIVYLKDIKNGAIINVDSAVVKNNKFVMTPSDMRPREAFISFKSNPSLSRTVIIEKGTLKINGDYNTFWLAEVSGTPSYNLMREYETLNKKYEAKRQEQTYKYQDELKLKGSQLMEALRNKFRAIDQDIQKEHLRAKKEFFKANSTSVFSAYAISKEKFKAYEDVEFLADALSSNIESNGFIDEINSIKKNLSSVVIGKKAPGFTLKTIDGKTISLKDFKGQVVLLDFWASWCQPCRVNNPKVMKLYEKYKNSGFTVIGISLDDKEDAWKAAVKADKLTWINVSELKGWNGDISKKYLVTAAPTTFLIDKKGNVASRTLHGDQLENKIKELIKK